MDEYEKYHFSDFTHTHYEILLKLAKQYYCFRDYTNFNDSENFIIWRHDIDFSVHAAYELAVIETRLGIRATYFVNLHSEFYNLLEKEIVGLVKEIISLGHHLALHFDWLFHNPQSREALECLLQQEKDMVEKTFAQKIKAFSFHNPNKFSWKYEQQEYVGMINAYSSYFKNDVFYVSDSNGYWRYRRLYDVLNNDRPPKLQVLTHPGCWTSIPMSPRERIERCIRGRSQAQASRYDAFLKQENRLNIGAPLSR